MENKLITKEDERVALRKIKKIVENLGSDSYLATAFDGVWEIAEKNIDNDWACSARKYIDNFYKIQGKLNAALNSLSEKEKEEDYLQDLVLEKNEKIQKLEYEFNESITAMKKELDEKDQETIRLKAKLYDLMTK